MPAGSDTRQNNLCWVLDPSEKISAGLDNRWNTFFQRYLMPRRIFRKLSWFKDKVSDPAKHFRGVSDPSKYISAWSDTPNKYIFREFKTKFEKIGL